MLIGELAILPSLYEKNQSDFAVELWFSKFVELKRINREWTNQCVRLVGPMNKDF